MAGKLTQLLLFLGRPFFALIYYSLFFVSFVLTHFVAILTVIFVFVFFVIFSISIFFIGIIANFARFFKKNIGFGKTLSLGLITLLLGIGIFLFSKITTFLNNLPDPKLLSSWNSPLTSKIYDRNGISLYSFFKNENRTYVPLSQVPVYTRLAVIAAEDASFYKHSGYSISGIIRSAIKNLQTHSLSYGGSTITQQLLKNTLLTNEKTWSRKIREIVLAINTERIYSKDQILEMYLNQVSYGGTTYGIEEASKTYFNKKTSELTLSESAFLAGLPKSPSTLSPYTNLQGAISRQQEVLKLMETNGFITADEYSRSVQIPIVISPAEKNILAPHFVMYVRDLLISKFGEEKLYRGGLNIYTTLDINVQNMAQEIVKQELNKVSQLNVTNGASLVVNPKTGEIIAMVGSKNYDDNSIDGNVNVTTRLRPPGSSIKIVTYSYALTHGMTPQNIIADMPTTFNIPQTKPYKPQNYDGQYRGNLTLRNAFAQSRNIPAVRVLYHFGLNNIIQMGRDMGIVSWRNPSDYGLSLTLGGADLTLLELTRVYSTVANYGRRPELNPLLKINTSIGQTIYQNPCVNSELTCNQPQVIDPRAAFQITDILNDNNARSASFGSNSALNIKNYPQIAVKTGTSNDLRDNLTVGYTPDLVVAVWVGNSNNSPMKRIASGITGAAPIWSNIMKNLIEKNKKDIKWEIPQGLTQINCNGRNDWVFSDAAIDKACSQIDSNQNSASVIFQPQI